MKNILSVTSEAVPFIKTGGLADVAGSLVRYIDKQEYDEKAKVASRITTKVEVVDGKNVKTRVFKKSGNEVK